jgi:glycine cleavage system transcriptional repressor
MAHFSLHAVGADRPGIVAAVARALADLGCNLEDSRMSLLRGQFSIMLVLSAPGIDNGAAIEMALAGVVGDFDLAVFVRPMPEEFKAPSSYRVRTLSIHGEDKAGILARVTGEIADHRASILDLRSHIGEGSAGASAVLVVTYASEPSDDTGSLEAALEAISAELGVHCVIADDEGGDS